MKKLAIGDSVQIKKGVKEYYGRDYDLSDWQGRILGIEYDECMFCGHKKRLFRIVFDSITLRQMPEEYILEMIKEGYGFADTEIFVKDVVAVSPRDTEEETASVRMELNKKYDWED